MVYGNVQNVYDKESAKGSIWVWQGRESESDQMVLKKLNGPILPNNVKSCKKIDEKAQTAKFTVFAVLKTWKTRETNSYNWEPEFMTIFVTW